MSLSVLCGGTWTVSRMRTFSCFSVLQHQTLCGFAVGKAEHILKTEKAEALTLPLTEL